MKKNKKITLMIISLVIVVILVCGLIVFILKHKKRDSITEENTRISTEEKYKIKEIKSNEISKDTIEVLNINAITSKESAKYEVLLKNTGKEDINGFYIEVALLDKNNDIVTTINYNSDDVIPAKGKYTINAITSDGSRNTKIESAKIIEFSKTLEHYFDEFDEIDEQNK